MDSNIHIQYNQERKQWIDFESLHLPKHRKDSFHSESVIERHSEVPQESILEEMNDERSQNPNTQSQCQQL
jgi:hypothetical protein